MDKLTAIKIKYDDGTYSDEIPVSALAENVEWDSTHTLVDILGSIDVDVTGTIQDQISQLFNEKVSSSELNNYVANQLNTDVTTWLNTYVNPVGSAVVVDSSLTVSGAAADAKIVGDKINNLDNLSNVVSFSLMDGYLGSGDGKLYPPTSDAQKSSDYIPVVINTLFIVTITFSKARYKACGICGYDENFNYIGRMEFINGGTAISYSLSHLVVDSRIKYIRFTFFGYNDIQNCTANSYINGSEIIKDFNIKISNTETLISNTEKNIKTELNKLKIIDGISQQFLNIANWELGYYNWRNNEHTAIIKNSAQSNWYCLQILNLPAGTYYYNKMGANIFSFIENIDTGTFIRADDAGIIETFNGNITINYDFNLYLSINQVYMNKDITMFANNTLPTEYIYGLYKAVEPWYINNQGQTTYIVGEGYIPTIQEACNIASENDIIFIKTGVYTEQVSIWNKKLHLIGENKTNTILIDHSGNYDTPPLEMSLGSITNLTIIEDGSEPTLDPSNSKYNMAYCLHIEYIPPEGEIFKITNVDFINYIHAPLGCGLYQNYTVYFKDCLFRCEASGEGNNERGSFYFHSNIHENIVGQKIIAENCIISSAGDKWSVLLGVPNGANNTGEAEARFSNCCIWNDNLGTADSICLFDTSGGTDVLKVVNSYGNTVNILNN